MGDPTNENELSQLKPEASIIDKDFPLDEIPAERVLPPGKNDRTLVVVPCRAVASPVPLPRTTTILHISPSLDEKSLRHCAKLGRSSLSVSMLGIPCNPMSNPNRQSAERTPLLMVEKSAPCYGQVTLSTSCIHHPNQGAFGKCCECGEALCLDCMVKKNSVHRFHCPYYVNLPPIMMCCPWFFSSVVHTGVY